MQRALRQRGQALLLALLVLGVAGGSVLFSYYRPTTLTRESDQKTTDALALAKTALIGYAIRGGDCVPQPTCVPQNPQRPGEFPCPDTNNDGFDDGTCVAGRLGRIPWKTLGIPEPKDSAGETLWYAVAGPFRSYNSGSLNNNPINSDTRGTIANPSLTVYAADGTTQLTTQAVAVIFAPGQALGSQNRDPNATAACTTSSSSPVALNRCAANYLETSAGTNNATTNGPFINGQRSNSYNDRVIYITTPEFIPIVEQRVAGELKTILQAYYTNSSQTAPYFPFAAAYDDTSGNCALDLRRGRVPSRITAAPNSPNIICGDGTTGLAEWPVCPLPNCLPDWFRNNQWYKVMYYSVAPGYVKGGTNNCTGGCLTVGSNASVPALFFMPGTPLNAAWRVSGVLDTDLTHYLEDTENRDGWGAGANAIYVTPATTTLDRDRIFILAGGALQCANNAALLLTLVPCGVPPRLNPRCSTIAANLAMCTCAEAATQMITTPCENTLKPSQCQSAAATLKACTS